MDMNYNPSLPTSYEYIHYTNENINTLDLNRAYTQTAQNLTFHRPNGLWLSIAGINDWEKYCLKNNYNIMNLKNEFQIKFKPHAQILILYNQAAFEDFEKKYGRSGEDRPPAFSIRWEEIIKDYQGLALPHIFPQLYNMGSWCDTWCCTSACIWDLQAVEKIEKIAA
jgi:hypothetical protein